MCVVCWYTVFPLINVIKQIFTKGMETIETFNFIWGGARKFCMNVMKTIFTLLF